MWEGAFVGNEFEGEFGAGPVAGVAVLAFVEAAGAVGEERAGAFEGGSALGEDVALDGHELAKGVVAEAVLGLGPACEDAGVGAGDVEQDEVGPAGVGGECGVLDGAHARVRLRAFAGAGLWIEGLRERGPASGVDVCGDDLGGGEVVGELAGLCSLPGAEVGDGFERGGDGFFQETDDVCRGGVLHPAARVGAEPGGQCAWFTLPDEVPGDVVRAGLVVRFGVFVGLVVDDRGGDLHSVKCQPASLGHAQGVGPDEQDGARHARAGGKKVDFLFGEYVGRELEGSAVGQRDVPAAEPPVFGHRHARAYELCDAAEHGVDQAPRARAERAFGPLDSVVERGVGGDALEQDDLCGPGQERAAHAGLEFRRWLAATLGDEALECYPPFGRGINDGVGESGVSAV